MKISMLSFQPHSIISDGPDPMGLDGSEEYSDCPLNDSLHTLNGSVLCSQAKAMQQRKLH